MIELFRYISALIQYKLSYHFPILEILFRTDDGFCKHFNVWKSRSYFQRNLPILYELGKNNDNIYWFSPGQKIQRIKLLEKAIKLCIKK